MDIKITLIKFRVQVSILETEKCQLDRLLILKMEVTNKILAEILTLEKISLHLHKARWSEVTTWDTKARWQPVVKMIWKIKWTWHMDPNLVHIIRFNIIQMGRMVVVHSILRMELSAHMHLPTMEVGQQQVPETQKCLIMIKTQLYSTQIKFITKIHPEIIIKTLGEPSICPIHRKFSLWTAVATSNQALPSTKETSVIDFIILGHQISKLISNLERLFIQR